jgi:hypothetical protein
MNTSNDYAARTRSSTVIESTQSDDSIAGTAFRGEA